MEAIQKNLGGRPTKYDPSFPSKVHDYLATATYENKHLPKIESFAIFLGVTKDTCYHWAKEYPEFSDALKLIMTRQAERLQDEGMYNEHVNPMMAKLILQANHGFRERTDTTSNDQSVQPLLVINANKPKAQEAEVINASPEPVQLADGSNT